MTRMIDLGLVTKAFQQNQSFYRVMAHQRPRAQKALETLAKS
jgi:hypothetical protein